MDRLGSGSVLWFGRFRFEDLLLFEHLLLFSLLILLFNQLSPHLLLFFAQAVLLRLPSNGNQALLRHFVKLLKSGFESR